MTNDEFDAKVTLYVRENPGKTFLSIHVACDAEDDRITDRALQRLRKRGVLSYSRKTGWTETGWSARANE